MAGAEPEPGSGGGSGSALPGQSHSTVPVAPLDPEQLRRVLEQVTRAQPPPLVLQDAAQRLRDAAQQAALQPGPGAGAPRLLPPQVRRRGGWRDSEVAGVAGVRNLGHPQPSSVETAQ